MSAILLFGLLAGVDNFQVAVGVGLSGSGAARRWALVWAFAIFEAVMPCLGAVIGQTLAARYAGAAELAGPCVLGGCGMLVLVAGFRQGQMRNILDNRLVLLTLPLLLSLDNLLAGAGFGAMGYPVGMTALAIGGISGLMCFAGMLLGRLLGARWPARASALGGVWLMFVACLAVCSG